MPLVSEERLTRSAVQRLEAWMKEVTDLLAYQPDIPMDHKTCVVNAMIAFSKELELMNKLRQKSATVKKPVN